MMDCSLSLPVWDLWISGRWMICPPSFNKNTSFVLKTFRHRWLFWHYFSRVVPSPVIAIGENIRTYVQMWIKTNPNKETNHKKTNKQNSDHWCKTTVTQKTWSKGDTWWTTTDMTTRKHYNIKCLDITVVVIWRQINKNELNYIKESSSCRELVSSG